jgi:hypothetical protein
MILRIRHHMTERENAELKHKENKNMIQSKTPRVAIPALLALFLALPIGAHAEGETERPAPETQSEIGRGAQEELDARKADVIVDAEAALAETQRAIEAIRAGDRAGAIAALATATGKLELVVARRPELALAPVAAIIEVVDFIGDIDTIRAVPGAASLALASGRSQSARRLLSGFASETVVRVQNLPMATYPAVIKEAARLLDAGRDDEAAFALHAALGTIVVKETVFPHPLLDAVTHLEAAKALAETEGRSAEQNQALIAALDAARTSLERAEAFGYGTSRDFRDLYAEIRDVERRTGGGVSITGLFTGMLDSVRGLFAGASGDPQQE